MTLFIAFVLLHHTGAPLSGYLAAMLLYILHLAWGFGLADEAAKRTLIRLRLSAGIK